MAQADISSTRMICSKINFLAWKIGRFDMIFQDVGCVRNHQRLGVAISLQIMLATLSIAHPS